MANTRVYIVPDSTGTQRSAYPSGNWQQVNAPSGLTATIDGYIAVLQWTDTNSGAASYVVQGSASASSGFSDAATTAAGATSATMSGLSVGTHYFRVFGQIGSVRSASPSAVVTVVIAEVIPSGQRVINGTGFGAGPDYILYDPAIGTPGDIYSLTGPRIGRYTEYGRGSGMGAYPRYYSESGRTWMAGRDLNNLASLSKLGAGVTFVADQPFSRFRLSYRVRIANGYRHPGAPLPNSRENIGAGNSVWKIIWMSRQPNYVDTNDVCIPTCVGNSTNIGGNAISPYTNSGTGSSGKVLSFNPSIFTAAANADNFLSIYVSGDESSPGATDATIEKIQAGNGYARTIHANDSDFFRPLGSASPLPSLDTMLVNGWTDNGVTTHENVLPLFADVCLAVGDNARACILVHSAPTLSASGPNIYTIPHDEWTNTEIRYTPEAWMGNYTSIIKADGTLLENVTWS